MISSALHGATLGGSVTLLIATGDPNQPALWALVVTSLAGIATQYLRARADRERDEQRHRFEMEERRAINEGQRDVVSGLAENAMLTRANSTQLARATARVVKRIDHARAPYEPEGATETPAVSTAGPEPAPPVE